MTPRFILLTFASCVVMFAAIWAATAPRHPTLAATTTAAPVLYADCDAVRAANAAPLRADQPGYRPALDPNMNGIACEPVGVPDTAPAIGTNPPPGTIPPPDEPGPVVVSPPPPPPPSPAEMPEENLPIIS